MLIDTMATAHEDVFLKVDTYDSRNSMAKTKTMYVFYDVTLGTFGIRGAHVLHDRWENHHSFYCDDVKSTVNFLNLVCGTALKTRMYLMRGRNLPEYSEQITWNTLHMRDKPGNILTEYEGYGADSVKFASFLEVCMTLYHY